jgi:hypothetical protein
MNGMGEKIFSPILFLRILTRILKMWGPVSLGAAHGKVF